MEQSKKLRLIAFVLSTVLTLCMIGCARVADQPGDMPVVSPPEEQPAMTPEPLRVYPAPKGFINDFADVLDATWERDVGARLLKLQQDRKVDFAIVTVSSTGPESIGDYSLKMTREWKVGSENGGLLLLVSIDDRKWRIQIDRKLEKVLTNDEVQALGDLMVPDFKRKAYADGIRKCVDAMIAALAKKLDSRTA